MSFHKRVIALVAVVAGLGAVFAIQPQSRPDLGSIARELRATLKDFDSRLRRMEKVVERFVKATGQPAEENAANTRSDEELRAANLLKAHEAYQRGRSEEAQHDYEQAIASYAQAVELDNRNDSAFLHRAYSYFETGRLDLALSDVDRSISIQPHNARAYAFRARIYQKLDEYDRSIADLEQALSRDPDNPEYLLARAGIEEERGDFRKAVEIYAKALDIKPGSVELRLKHAAALKQINETQKALKECTAAITLNKASAEAYACRADAYVRLDQVVHAIEDLEQAFRLKPDFPEATNLAAAIRQLADLQELAGEIDRSSDLSAVAEELSASAEELSAAAEELSAPEALRDADAPVSSQAEVKPSPQRALEQVKLGRAYTKQGKYAEAIDALTEAVKLDPSIALAYNSRGYAYLRSRQLETAIRDFTAAIANDPNYANAYWNRAVAKMLRGDQPGSLEDRRKAAELGWVNTGVSAIRRDQL